MLPKIATPKYDMIVPSTGKSITYRPYVVKEEKILLIAMESDDNITIENAIQNLIKACVETAIDINKLTSFDVEFMFANLRAVSVGEGIKINPKCSAEDCDARQELKVNINEAKIENLDTNKDRTIKINDDISVELKWLAMKDRLDTTKDMSDTEVIIQTLAKSISTIYSGEEIFNASDSKPEEVVDFVESLNSDQFSDLMNKVSNTPYLSYKFEYDCAECGTKNKRELKGLQDFFG